MEDATQNHYGTFDWYSPMVFLGIDRYTVETPLYATLTKLAEGRTYSQLLHLTDEPADVLQFIQTHPPILKKPMA